MVSNYNILAQDYPGNQNITMFRQTEFGSRAKDRQGIFGADFQGNLP